jgi:hypothetical protein
MSTKALSSGRRAISNGERVAAQHHQGDEPLDCSLAVSVESEELSDVPYGCSFGLDLPAFGAHAGAEAQRRLQGLIEQVLLVAVALLPLHAHRVGSDCSIR